MVMQMGDHEVEVSEEKRDEAQIAKGKAMEAMAEGNLLFDVLGSLHSSYLSFARRLIVAIVQF